jgi:uncharacterized protein (UPF0248 family)
MNPGEVRELLSKEVLEKDALNRIKWDSSLDEGEFSIRYVDRTRNDLVEVPYAEIEVEGEFMRHQESLIPLHRIREIVHKGEVVWAKRRK